MSHMGVISRIEFVRVAGRFALFRELVLSTASIDSTVDAPWVYGMMMTKMNFQTGFAYFVRPS